jgi:hypothetical protein
MKEFTSKTIISLLFFCITLFGFASIPQKNKSYFKSETTYQKHLVRSKKMWNKLMPSFSKIHFFGGIGTVSVGLGWDYGKKNQWETDVYIGILPKYSDKKTKATFTAKQNFYPWKIRWNRFYTFEPLSCSIYFNTIFGDQFWTKDPDRYPKGYYQVPTRIRTHLAIGQRITYNFCKKDRLFWKSVSLYYEITSCDFYIISAVQNSYLKPWDYLNLAFGVKLQVF